MKVSSSRVTAPVAIKCRCGKRIVLEPRWLDKPSACAGCEADFVVSMVQDPKTKKWLPHLRYTPTVLPDKVRKGQAGYTWANVTCECGSKIGVEERFFGRNMVCSTCQREFIVRLRARGPSGRETAVMEFRPRTRRVAAASVKPPAEAKAQAAKPPSEMHLLCTCGEELVVPSLFYNQNMYCAGCGALMFLRLFLNEKSGKYELFAKIIGQAKEDTP